MYYGSSTFPQVDSLVICDNWQGNGRTDACPVGDVNGDGIGDFTSVMTGTGKLWLGSTNLSPVWNAVLGDDFFGPGLLPTLKHGDFNGDGYEDIVGSDYDYGYWSGRVGIWLGHQQFNGTVDLIINYPQYQSMQFGWAKAAGDFNADGYCDLAVSSPYFDGGPTSSPGYIYIYSGNAQLIDTTVDVEDDLAPVPENIWELNAYPNPFRGGALHIELNKVHILLKKATLSDQVEP
ncbi:MAG TPA: FG-GAP repeat protein, partial [Candidatus Cloacimonadota bacterium]|nr:FG-GAP repeat protein [Candidatus Cloacimonadota bacterium]